VMVAWALYRPLSQIAVGLFREFRTLRAHHLRFGASAAFTLAVMAVIAGAIYLSRGWPDAAKPVPLTACYMALGAALLNLINELFGRQTSATKTAGAEGGVHTAASLDLGVSSRLLYWRATSYFLWLAAFVGAIALIGFLPAIAVFIFGYMRFGFGERTLSSAGFALATAVFCWLLFDQALANSWPHSLLGDVYPQLRDWFRFI
jgi:hypothetical protein